MKTSELTGAALDWAVAKCETFTITKEPDEPHWLEGVVVAPCYLTNYKPSEKWEQGGPIIERERIRIDCPWNPGLFEATCRIDGVTGWMSAPTVLTAAMRCYVAAKLGDEIDVPEELK